VDGVPLIWQNCLYVEEPASDLAELPVPVIWQNCLHVEEHANDDDSGGGELSRAIE
jgi:hypothetical protein